MLGARRGVHTGYVAASERSGALLIGAERLAEGAGLLLIGHERLADLAAWLLIDTERPPERSEGLPLGTGCLRHPLGGLMVVAAGLIVTAARVGCRCWVWRRVRSRRRIWRRIRCRLWCRRWCRGVAAAGLAAADVVELGAVLDAEEHADECRQLGRWRQHAQGVQHVVGLAIDGLRLRQVEQAVQSLRRSQICCDTPSWFFQSLRLMKAAEPSARSTDATDSLLSMFLLP